MSVLPLGGSRVANVLTNLAIGCGKPDRHLTELLVSLLPESRAGIRATAIEAADDVAGLQVLWSDLRRALLVTDVGLPGGITGRQVAVRFITGSRRTL